MSAPTPVGAFFDVDGTLTQTTILHPLVWYQRDHLSRLRFALWAAGLALDVPRLVLIDRRSRGRLNIVFFHRYAGLPADDVRAWHLRTFDDNLRRRIYAAAAAAIEDHRRQGHRIVLVTGGLDFVMRPLGEYLGAADVMATHLAERDGVFTGEIMRPPIAEEHKGDLVRACADKHGIDLAHSFAYTDSIGDLSMLQCVGHPIAVNADRRLRRLAAARGWPIENWRRSRT
jgi:HAD superfamily hydrolase (TIGR01490 family)